MNHETAERYLEQRLRWTVMCPAAHDTQRHDVVLSGRESAAADSHDPSCVRNSGFAEQRKKWAGGYGCSFYGKDD